MTDYRIQAKLSNDGDLLARAAACAAGKGQKGPTEWAFQEASWPLAVTPGWWKVVADGDGTSAAITDEMIEARVETLLEQPASDRNVGER